MCIVSLFSTQIHLDLDPRHPTASRSPATFRDPWRSEYLPQIIWATIPAICEAAGKQMLFFHLWNQVVGLQSALWAASGKRWILKWQCCLCAASRLVSERQGLPVTPNWTMKHDGARARLAICSELLSARSAAHHEWSLWWIIVPRVAFGRFTYIQSWHFELRCLITWLICIVRMNWLTSARQVRNRWYVLIFWTLDWSEGVDSTSINADHRCIRFTAHLQELVRWTFHII